MTPCPRPVTSSSAAPAVAHFLARRGTLGHPQCPATGLALAELIADGPPSSVDLTPFDPARLRPVRPRP